MHLRSMWQLVLIIDMIGEPWTDADRSQGRPPYVLLLQWPVETRC